MPVFTNALSFGVSDMNSNITSLMVYEASNGSWALRGKVTSGNGRHAEEELAADLRGSNKLGITPGTGILIEITKSPCHDHQDGKDCSQVLIDLKESGSVGSVEVKYLGIYQLTSHENTWRSVAGMVALEANDIPCDEWDYTRSPNANQTQFMKDWQQKCDNGQTPKGFFTNPRVRKDNQNRKPSDKFWKTEM